MIAKHSCLVSTAGIVPALIRKMYTMETQKPVGARYRQNNLDLGLRRLPYFIGFKYFGLLYYTAIIVFHYNLLVSIVISLYI